MMDASLLVVGGEVRSNHVKLKLPTTIGRGREATITIAHPMTSRLHCEIYQQRDWLYVRDLGSLNGTFVNNQRISSPQRLEPGQLLTAGSITFKVVYDEPWDASEPTCEITDSPTLAENDPLVVKNCDRNNQKGKATISSTPTKT